MKKFFEGINKSIKKYKLYVLKDVAIFVIIVLSVHFAYRFWANSTNYWPIPDQMHKAHEEAATIVFNQSVWIIQHIYHIPITTSDPRVIHFSNGGFIGVNQSCSGLKPIIQFVLLMLIFPGPWKHKAWFIPVGVLIVHFTNLFRITGLAVITITVPEYWHFAHDNLFRPFFYVVIFFLWVLWVEKFKKNE